MKHKWNVYTGVCDHCSASAAAFTTTPCPGPSTTRATTPVRYGPAHVSHSPLANYSGNGFCNICGVSDTEPEVMDECDSRFRHVAMRKVFCPGDPPTARTCFTCGLDSTDPHWKAVCGTPPPAPTPPPVVWPMSNGYTIRFEEDDAPVKVPLPPSLGNCIICGRQLSRYLDAYYGNSINKAKTCVDCRGKE